ncbi:choline kinase [Suhomyces tanzawaensis NRRL Y-17324]|uniref:Choline kinase n=1 Tax=Suhomyces tanzawaensis NRRL Y-17324 TaxID=984487 RepID=A0A1E4SGF9_9ASCO|nr:choline kinase [Suhomyces tanzawaensis NRRL Y-17324]ODV78597.1 choline kinase [Suhomyces tanzawaensis NRRL Y-17324]
MEFTPAYSLGDRHGSLTNLAGASRSRSRSRSRNRKLNASSRSNSNTRRPSLSGGKRSLSASSLTKLTVTPTNIDADKSIPTVSATLDNSLPLDFFKQELIALIKALKISKWHKRQLTIANMSVSRISGALTNSIYQLEYNDPQQHLRLPALLLRVYGKNVDSIIDRELELEILIKLSQKRIGPRLLGIFSNGRFEQFLEGFNTLSKDQIRDEVLSQILGRRMKDLHYKIELDPKDTSSDLPMSWKLIYKWLDIFETLILPNYVDKDFDTKEVFLLDFYKFKQLIEKYKTWLFAKYEPDSFTSNYKFCHNDTQYGNLLLHESFKPDDIIVDKSNSEEKTAIKSTSNKKDGNLVVIDFEYSGPNFPAYDLANHFSEWMADYHDPVKSYYIHEDQFPNQIEQLNLIKAYVEYEFQFPSSNIKTGKTSEQHLIDNSASELVQYEIKKMYNECIYWRATVQIYWCLWGLIQNGPLKSSPASPPHIAPSKSEMGVDSTYNITTALESATLEDNELVEEAITSNDDDFDYLKYSQQKSALIVGEMIGLGLLEKEDIDEKYWDLIKYLDCKAYDL